MSFLLLLHVCLVLLYTAVYLCLFVSSAKTKSLILWKTMLGAIPLEYIEKKSIFCFIDQLLSKINNDERSGSSKFVRNIEACWGMAHSKCQTIQDWSVFDRIVQENRYRSTLMGRQSERKRIYRIVTSTSRHGEYMFVQRKSRRRRRRRRRRRQPRLLFKLFDICWLIWSCRRVCSLGQHLLVIVQRCIIWSISRKRERRFKGLIGSDLLERKNNMPVARPSA